jgi:hypothetical protein
MPSPEELRRNKNNMYAIKAEQRARAFDHIPITEPKVNDLLNEIRGLRNAIDALRADLLPVPSLILTGKEALDEFKRLSGGA